jgi:anti-sigma regulatory factor (Ser/Thr protein kinase)
MEAQAAFPAELVSAARARRFTEETLASWSCDALVEPARLLVSELVVNAIIHAQSAASLRLEQEGSVLRVSVADGSTSVPKRRPYSPTATTGRGLMILDAVADDWGVEIGPDGKVVWFELTLVHEGLGSGSCR